MIRKKYIVLTAALFAAIASLLLYNSIPKPTADLSAPYAEILQSGCYYMDCSVSWLLNTPELTRLELARSGKSSFQRYRRDGEAVTTITRNGTAQVFLDEQLLEETQNSLDAAPDYANLLRTGKQGSITLEGEQFTYEEYRLGEEPLRFLFQGEELRGLQAGRQDTYTRVVTLTADIPAEIQTVIAQ